MFRLVIRSRSGNLALAALGVMYAVTSLVVLVWHVKDVWAAASMIDRAIQMCLAGTLICGLWLAFVGVQNLRDHWPARRHHGLPAATRSSSASN